MYRKYLIFSAVMEGAGSGRLGGTATAVDFVDAIGAENGSETDKFEALRIKRVVRETVDAVSLVLDVPSSCAQRFRYRAGQYLILQVQVNGREHRRCYSMSSAPVAGEHLRITVKRDRDGVVSNWLNDAAAVGEELRAAPPQGRFVLRDTARELVAFAGGSGITPVFSLISSALATTGRRLRLFYANRSRDSVIFGDSLALMVDRNPDRLLVQRHFDEDSGVVQPGAIEAFIAGVGDADYYICGPTPFMDTAEKVLLGAGVPADRLRLERFEIPEIPIAASDVAASENDAPLTEKVTIELDRQMTTVRYREGETLLQTARSAGLRAPSSCETGSCGTCMARLTEGSARMLNNDALDDDEVAQGWVLTCQSLPIGQSVRVVYE